ncbi:E3 ubiquitin-protein ligase MSL2-like [Uloborus diversus]|uniref:E3 ubiquitin-protein ligase MSL2-like n=1 Tax=Uloborus diversus TaxID=327109 RepID=UPI0024098482|nr:E3 ubiquitin-protein ligase MSL2-like [Uloborus diversus]
MSALSLYINTFRIVLEVNPEEDSSWAHIYGSLSCLRQYLSCCVCEKLLLIPMKSTIGRCRHFRCKTCVGGKMKKGGTCSHCAVSSEFVEDVQMRIVLQCFRKMCLYICCCSFYRNVDRSDMSVPKSKFYYIVNEGANYNDDTYPHMLSSNMADNQLTVRANITDTPRTSKRAIYRIKVKNSAARRLRIQKRALKASLSHRLTEDDDNSVQEVSSTEVNQEVEEREGKQMSCIDSEESSDSSSFMKECIRSFRKRSHCRCGMATRNPGKLTCCGQRCPCYVAGRACFNCHCRGCRNPQKLVVTPPSSHHLLADGESNLSSESLKDLNGIFNSSDETSLNDSSDEYTDELYAESM